MNPSDHSLLPSRVRAVLELFRLPNVFTAMADVCLGFFLSQARLDSWAAFLCLLAASSCLYLAGMVLNDYYDRLVDARSRPHRPIPSGRISPVVARWIGFALLLLGVGLGWLAGVLAKSPASSLTAGVVACLLACAVWGYDARLKQTWLGPLTMGSCRFLNVLLGMSAASVPWEPMHWMVAGGVGIYIVGVTWLARTEAVTSNRLHLALATVTLWAGMAVLWDYPSWWHEAMDPVSYPRLALADPRRWSLFWMVLAALIGWRCVLAVVRPEPSVVQRAVKHCIMSLIVLDAAACFAVRGWPHATAILLLLVPTMFLGRWIYST